MTRMKTSEESSTAKSKFPCRHPNCIYSCSRRYGLAVHIQRMHRAKSDRPYECKFCQWKFITFATLDEHIRTHTGEKPIKCTWPNCFYAARTQKLLRQHKLTHTDQRKYSCKFPGCLYKAKTRSAIIGHHTSHKSDRPFHCPLCPYKAKLNSALKRHTIDLHSMVKRFECPEKNCGFTSNRSEGLKRHQKRIHPIDGEIVSKILCSFDPNCKFQTVTPYYMKKHVMHRHTKEKPFHCPMCPFKCVTATYLKRHMVTHTGERPYGCKICQKDFAFATNLRDHIRAVHDNEKNFKCKFCKSKFFSNSHLQKHTRIHTGEKPYECQICHTFFTQMIGLKAHLKVHSGVKGYECKICAKKFLAMGTLRDHMLIHGDHKPLKCKLCDYRGRTSGALGSHIRSNHTKEKPEKCVMCHKFFSNRHILNLHIRTHTGEKPYGCPVCNYSSRTGALLKSHLRWMHQKKEEGGGFQADPQAVLCVCPLCGFGGDKNGKIDLNEHYAEEHDKIPFVSLERLNLSNYLG